MNNNQLNTIASIINAHGFVATKNSTLSTAVLAGIAAGADLKTAFNHVFGAGAFEKFAGDLYDTLRAQR